LTIIDDLRLSTTTSTACPRQRRGLPPPPPPSPSPPTPPHPQQRGKNDTNITIEGKLFFSLGMINVMDNDMDLENL